MVRQHSQAAMQMYLMATLLGVCILCNGAMEDRHLCMGCARSICGKCWLDDADMCKECYEMEAVK